MRRNLAALASYIERMATMKDVAGLAAIVAGSALVGLALSHGSNVAFAAPEPQQAQSRDVGPFERIRLEGPFSTTIAVGPKPGVSVRGDAASVGNVTTTVRDGTLVVGVRHGVDDLRIIAIAIAVPHLRELTNDGAGSSTISGVADDIEIENSGAGSIRAFGRSNRETVSLEGVGEIDTTGIRARDVTATNDGVGAVYVRGSGTLSLQVNGVGEIRYAGNPTHVEKRVDGIGRISAM